MRIAIIFTIFFVCAVQMSAQKSVSESVLTVKLDKKILPSTGRLEGISNIFFQESADAKFQYPADWKEVETASVLENKAFFPVYAIRHKPESGQFEYVVDTDGNMDFRNETVLQFHQDGDVKIADFSLKIQPVDRKQKSQQVNYQVIISNDGYIYARISEYRQGRFLLDNDTYNIRILPRSRNNPVFNLLPETICLIDRNRDDVFTKEWRLSDNGEILQAEEINIASPFMLGERKWKITALDTSGTTLKMESANEEISTSVGFKAPPFQLTGLDDKKYDLSQYRGKIVFLEFWSTNCPFCKHILPKVNDLIKKNLNEDFAALAIAREDGRAEIENYQKQEAKNAVVIPGEKTIWQTYNSLGITPTFYLIDQQGIIRFSGYGASAELIEVIDKLTNQLREKEKTKVTKGFAHKATI